MFRLIRGAAATLFAIALSSQAQLIFNTTAPANYEPGNTITIQVDVTGTIDDENLTGFAIVVKNEGGIAPAPVWTGAFPGSGTSQGPPDAFSPNDANGEYQFVYTSSVFAPDASFSLDLTIPAGFTKEVIELEYFFIDGFTPVSFGTDSIPAKPVIALTDPVQSDATTAADSFTNTVTAGQAIPTTFNITSGDGGATLTDIVVESQFATFTDGSWQVDAQPARSVLNITPGVDDADGNFSWTFAGDALTIVWTTADDLVLKGEAADDRIVGLHVTATNSFGSTASQDVFTRVTPINQPPVITAPGNIIDFDEGGEDFIDLEATDVDNDPGDLDWTVTTPATNGTVDVTIPQTGRAVTVSGGFARFTYTPNDADFFGTDSFTVTVDDDEGGTDTFDVDVTVNNVNDKPTATDDNPASFPEDSDANAINVLANDNGNVDDTPNAGFGAQDEELLVTAKTDGDNGTVTITGGGTGLTYTPDANFFGPDVFTYTITDDGDPVQTSSATVNVTVTNVNDDPVARDDDPGNIDEDSGANVFDVLANDDGDVDDPPGLGFGTVPEDLTRPARMTLPTISVTATAVPPALLSTSLSTMSTTSPRSQYRATRCSCGSPTRRPRTMLRSF
jgi:hypothetical protein